MYKKLIATVSALFVFGLLVAPISARVVDTPANGLAVGSAMLATIFSSLFCFLPFMLIPILLIGVQIYLVIDATKRDFGKDENMLAVSILILMLAGFPVGTILYYYIVMQKYPKKS